MKKISQEELDKILEKHKMWLMDREGGEKADLRYTDLTSADLRYADLSHADLRNSNLTEADLSYADLRGADLRGADLNYTNLRCADLRYANLSDTGLNYADLRYADLRGADLTDAYLRDSNLDNIKTNMYTIGYHLACPEEGSFIGYKKAGNCIVKLLILEDSKRSSATSLKCRCSKAKVLDIEDMKTGFKVVEVRSKYDSSFIYKVGEIVSVDDFDEDRWNECSTGIHFFMNKENAINY